MAKQRLDVLLVEQGLVPSRERAKTSIMAGLVFVDGQRVDKPGAVSYTHLSRRRELQDRSAAAGKVRGVA